MTNRIYNILSLLAALWMVGCSESLEDTYDEFTEGGMIRYVGKCSNVEVNPGWERLQVIWKNNIDAGIKNVKVTWQSENETIPYVRYIDRSNTADEEDLMDTIYLENLTDAVYTVRVSNITADSVESLVEEKYGRPYTENHEDLRTFSRGISAFSRMNNKLAVILDQDNENIKELLLCYYDKQGNKCVWNTKEHMTDILYDGTTELGRDYMFLLPEDSDAEIDFNRPLTLERKGKLAGCVDEITFPSDTLNLDERLRSTEFSQLMASMYGLAWESKVNELTTLELDYDIMSMQDLMYFPRLEKVVLGKNRYMQPSYAQSFYSTTDTYLGLSTLAFLNETRENFVVERYNNHYFDKDDVTTYIEAYKNAGKIKKDFTFIEKGSANLDDKPQYQRLDTIGWEITCSDTLRSGYVLDGAAMLLFDGPDYYEDFWSGETYMIEYYFEPNQTIGASIVTVTYDMKTPQVVAGFKAAQPYRNESGDTDYLLSSLKVEFSTDGYVWTNATNTEGSVTLGTSPGEETFIIVPKELQTPVRYIRLTMSNRLVGSVSGQGLYSLRLGAFIPLKSLTLPNP